MPACKAPQLGDQCNVAMYNEIIRIIFMMDSSCSVYSIGSSKPFHLPRHFVFPKRIISERARYCQRSWFDIYEFLHYDVSKDAILCHTCIQAVQQRKIRNSKCGDPAFVSD